MYLVFVLKNEIIHQTSCSHTSKQNEVAERKQRHILDVAITLMIHMSVPKYLWFDDVLSACYLISRISSSILNKRSLFSYLYANKNPFSMTPRVFEFTYLFRTCFLG